MLIEYDDCLSIVLYFLTVPVFIIEPLPPPREQDVSSCSNVLDCSIHFVYTRDYIVLITVNNLLHSPAIQITAAANDKNLLVAVLSFILSTCLIVHNQFSLYSTAFVSFMLVSMSCGITSNAFKRDCASTSIISLLPHMVAIIPC